MKRSLYLLPFRYRRPFVASLCFFTLFSISVARPLPTNAQEAMTPQPVPDATGDFQVGQHIEFRYRTDWYPGTILKIYPSTASGLRQALIQWDPHDYPNAKLLNNAVSTYQQAYSLTDIRSPVAHALVKTPTIQPEATTTVDMGTGLMTKAEIRGYLHAHAYVDGKPTRDPQVAYDLIAMMKKRGVQEPLKWGISEDSQPAAENGYLNAYDTDVITASSKNLGVPTTVSWLADTWLMTVVGGTIDRVHSDGRIYRQSELVANLGFLTIHTDGTYVWKVLPTDPPAKYLTGTWRKATSAEMKLQGGTGLVLNHGQEGIDWIVYKFMDANIKAERIEVEDLVYRGGHRLIGWRR